MDTSTTSIIYIHVCYNRIAFIGNWLSGVFGESMTRYRYDLESGTSHYRNSDGSIDSWQSPQRRGTQC